MADIIPDDPLADPLLLASRWHHGGERVALATVTETWGSAPRPAGSRMAITESGRIAGSVSGGCVESAVVQAAVETLQDRAPRLLSYGVSDEDAFSVGLACGGTIKVFVEPVLAAETIDRLCAARGARAMAVLATRLSDGTQHLVCEGSLPQGLPDGLDGAIRQAEREGGRSRSIELAGESWFLHVHAPPPRLLIVGAVHIAQALAPLARMVGLDVTVIDPRESFATPERFPGIALLTLWPDEALERLRLDRHSAVVTLTHDPKLDDPALRAALGGPAFYVGALGSRKTQAGRRERLRAAGLDEASLDRLHGPVGLAIGAIGAQEIAVSILAEIVAVQRAAPLGSRRA